MKEFRFHFKAQDAFDLCICISNADQTIRYDKSKQKTSTFDN